MSTDLEELTQEELDVVVPEVDEHEVPEEVDEAEAPTLEDAPSTVPNIEAQIADLEASNKGLVKALSAQRGLRQELQGQLDEIKQAISAVKAVKPNAADNRLSANPTIPIDFDDEGNPFLDPAKLSTLQLRSVEIENLQKEINLLKQTSYVTKQQQTEQQNLNALLSENENYAPAYKKVTEAWNYLKDDLFDAYLIEKGLPTPTTAEAAIEIATSSKELMNKFEQKFPGVDMESVLEAHLIATPRYLRKALNKASVVNAPTKKNSSSPLDFNRPASLAAANTSGGENQESLLSRIASMSNEDFMALDRKTMAKIDRLLEARG
jgi:hypothetical protein